MFEYKVIGPEDRKQIETKLNQLGKYEWEIAWVLNEETVSTKPPRITVFLKRRKQ